MRPSRDVTVFVGLAIAYSTLIALAGRDVLTSNSLFAVTVASVILAARGDSWQRKVSFAVIALGGFVAFERWTDILGLDQHLDSFAVETAATALGIGYTVFTLAYPLAILLLFVGRDPSVLWVRAAEGGGQRRKKPGVKSSTKVRGKR